MKLIRRLTVLSVSLFFFLNISAQTKDSVDVSQFIVAYTYKWNTADRNGSSITDSVKIGVQVGTKITKCKEFFSLMYSDLKEWKNKEYMEGEWISRPYNIPTWFQNYPEGETRTFDKVIPNRFVVAGKKTEIHWTLESDTLSIAGYLCHKAVGNYGGRKWTAWYSEEISSPVGPWKLRGLPGLILKAEDNEHIHSFSFCGLLLRQDPITYTEHPQSIRKDQKEFIKFRNKTMCSKRYVEDPRYYIPEGALADAVEMWDGGPEPDDSKKYTTLAIDMIVPKTVNVYQPLELE